MHVPKAISWKFRRASSSTPHAWRTEPRSGASPATPRYWTSTPPTATCCGAATSPPPPWSPATTDGRAGRLRHRIHPPRAPGHARRLAGRRRRRAPRPGAGGRAAGRADRPCRRTSWASRRVETTITPDNAASNRLFTSFAERHGAPLEREVLFDAGAVPRGAATSRRCCTASARSATARRTASRRRPPCRSAWDPAPPHAHPPPDFLILSATHLPGACCDHHPARPERLRDPGVGGAQLLPQLAHRLRPRAGQPHVRRGRPHVPRLLRRRRVAQLRPQQPGPQTRPDRLHRARRRHPRPGHVDHGQAGLPGDVPEHRPASRATCLQGHVPGPDGHQRRRGRAEAGPQGQGPRVDRLLHQRLPRHVAGLARRHRQLLEARPAPASRWCTAPRCRSTTTSTAPTQDFLLVRAAARGPGLRPQQARRRDRRDRAGRGRHQRRPRRVAARASPTCASATTCC